VPTALFIVIGLAVVGIVAWLATSGIWLIAKWICHETHVDEKVDHFFDVDGGLSESDYLKFKEQHPHGGRG
jgi:hypothetical protein